MRGGAKIGRRTAALAAALALGAGACTTPGGVAIRPVHRAVRWGGARALVAGGLDGRGAGDGPVLVYLHGFASSPADQQPLSRGLALPVGTRFVYPEGPVQLGARSAWWRIDRAARRRYRSEPGGLRELAGGLPAGRAASRAVIEAVLAGVERDLGAPRRQIVLGGFSQGAMAALDAALHLDRPPGGIALLSGTMVAASDWVPRMRSRRGLPVLVSHGRRDPQLPFALAERLAARLTEAGLEVWWHPHDRGHVLDPGVMPAFADFAQRVWDRSPDGSCCVDRGRLHHAPGGGARVAGPTSGATRP